MKQRHIALGTDFGLLPARRKTECGWGIEGYNGTGAANVSNRISKLGGTLAYVVADEPLFFGHDYNGANACRADISDLARQAAQTANIFRSFFPNIKIAEAEPIGNFWNPKWLDEISEFLNAFEQAYGSPFVFFAVDISWQLPWKERALKIANYLQMMHMPIGVFYNGNPTEQSDERWVAQAKEHYKQFEALIGRRPDYAMIQTWLAHPTRILPETAQDALSNVLADYVDRHQLLSSTSLIVLPSHDVLPRGDLMCDLFRRTHFRASITAALGYVAKRHD